MVRNLALVAATLTVVAACAPGQSSSSSGGTKGGTVHVLGSWGGSEQESFLAMVKPFEDRTGITVQYEGTRDLNAVLTTRVQAGNPPELAGLPGPGQMAEFAAKGKLVSLDNVLDTGSMQNEYPADLLKLGKVSDKGQIGSGKTYSIFIKTALKGLIWYDPKNFQSAGLQPAKSWEDLTALQNKIAATGTTPWCMGIESAATSGWPGSDFIKEIVLSQSGPDVYDKWWQGKQKWTSPEIKKAWQVYGQIVSNPSLVYGGKQTILSTAFGDAGNPLFATPPKCYIFNQASFMTDFFVKANPNLKPGQDFNFFNQPEVNSKYAGAHVIGGDLFGMFKDTDQARQLIKYLTTSEAQAIWVKRGGAISANTKVSLNDYPDDLSRQIGQTLTTAKIERFDAADLMPNAMQSEFFKAVVDYVNDPSKLDSILAHLDSVQADAYK